MWYRSFRHAFAVLTAAVTALVFTSAGVAADKPPTPIDESAVNPTSERFHGEGPQVEARTIQYWTGQATNPVDHLTYSYSMVGVDPASNGAASIEVDIVPVNVTVGGRAFNGSDVTPAVLASPLFQTGDYSSTTAASTRTGAVGAGGELSAGNVDVQLLDATMRSQFNKVGTGYHLYLTPIVRRAVSIDVPASSGFIRVSPVGIANALVDKTWFQPQVEGMNASLHYLQPHRLALFITNDVMLYTGAVCCAFGAHGTTDTTAEGNGSDGRQSLQTFVWASWLTPGSFNPANRWAMQDISGLSHEIAEWAADPFETNYVQPWSSPVVAPQYGCNNELEVGDPVVRLGFSQGTNAYEQGPTPSGLQIADGTYHPQDEVFMPWFMRISPNDISQPTQSDPTAGRYTFMGELNRVPIFHQAGNGC
jgi:hypothetical protein